MFNYYTSPSFNIDVYMSDYNIGLVRDFCRKMNNGPVHYPIYHEINGPILIGKQTSVRLSCRYNCVSFDVLKETLSCGWGLTVAQVIALKFTADSVTYDNQKIKSEDFLKLHPYANQLKFSNRILNSLSHNNSFIANIHKQKIEQINEILLHYKNNVKGLLKNIEN